MGIRKKFVPTFSKIMREMERDAEDRQKRIDALGDIDEYLKDI